eukprot:3213952-Pyramimonas_sp.AAC.1
MTTGQDRQKLVVGVIGGMSPASTVVYYQELNRLVRCRLGGNSSADIIEAAYGKSLRPLLPETTM